MTKEESEYYGKMILKEVGTTSQLVPSTRVGYWYLHDQYDGQCYGSASWKSWVEFAKKVLEVDAKQEAENSYD